MSKTKESQTKQEQLFPSAAPELVTESLPIDLIDGPLLGDAPGMDLVESVRRVGILVPVLVQRVAKGREVFFIVDGRRRLKAAKQVGLSHVPTRVLPPDVENPEVFTLQSNMTRRANPVSEYHAIRDLVSKGWSEKDIVKQLGMKSGVLKQRLALGNLIPVLLDLLETGKIGATVGEAAAKLPHVLQDKLVEVFASNDDRLTVKDVGDPKRVRREEKTASLSDVIFGDGEKKKTDARVALSHLDAAEELLKSLGVEVDFETYKTRLGQIVD